MLRNSNKFFLQYINLKDIILIFQLLHKILKTTFFYFFSDKKNKKISAYGNFAKIKPD